MPFISKDWRSPGEQWVKIGPGWERAKVLNYLSSGYFQQHGEGKDESIQQPGQPQYNVTTRTTREIRRQNTLSEALLQLDFYSACHDIRKFNYTCRMIQLLLFNMNYLPGNVQRILIRLVEEMAAYAKENGWKGEVHHVLQAIRDNMQNQPVWGGQLGSTKLWEEHKLHFQKILNSNNVDDFESNKAPPMQDFPEEIVRQILLKLSSDKDIESLANSNLLLSQIADENRVWRELCNYHFTPQQIELIHQQLLKLKGQSNKTFSNYAAAKRNNQNKNNNNQLGSRSSSMSSNSEDSSSDGETKLGSSPRGDYYMSRRGAKNSDSCSSNDEDNENKDHTHHPLHEEEEQYGDIYPHWKLKFKTLKRKYGLAKEEYAEELNLCKSCGLLFWTAPQQQPNHHHDCGIPILIPVKPGDFIKYFCV